VRQNIRREMNRNRKQGVTIRALNEPVAQAGCLHAIVDRHFRRYGWQAFPYGPGWFGSVKSALGDDAVLAVALQHGQPVGVALQLRQQGTRQLILVCVDHAGEGGNFTHFNLAYYWAVEDCIRAGDRRYVVGPGQHDSRTRRGYRPRESFVFCRPPGRVRRRFIGAWLRLLEARLRRKA
jgi:predicted N-acyltransferase